MPETKIETAHKYIELDVQPNIVQSMKGIEKSMLNAVNRLRSIKERKQNETVKQSA